MVPTPCCYGCGGPASVAPIWPLCHRCSPKKKKKNHLKTTQRSYTVAQQDRQCLCSTRTQARSPAQHSRLKDQAMIQLWLRFKLGQIWSLNWELHMLWGDQKQKRKKRKKQKQTKKKTQKNKKWKLRPDSCDVSAGSDCLFPLSLLCPFKQDTLTL